MSSSGRREHRQWDPSCKVYVGNLLNDTQPRDLEDAFSKYGPVRTVWVARNPPGFAFIEFEDTHDAEDSVRGLDSTRICGSRVRVEMSSGPKRNRGSARSSRKSRSPRRSGSPRRSRSPRRRRSRSRSRSPVSSSRRRSPSPRRSQSGSPPKRGRSYSRSRSR